MSEFDFSGIDSFDWLKSIPNYAAGNIKTLLSSGKTEEEVINIWLTKYGSQGTAPYGANTIGDGFYVKIKNEFNKLICGDPAYNEIRKQISSHWLNNKTAVVSYISIAIAASLGIAAAVLTPVIAILLSLVAKVGVNAWCAS